MVMIFSSDKARSFLLEHGRVYTFRKNRRKRVGRDWITDRRGGRKIADVTIEEEAPVFHLNTLRKYVGESGFQTVDEWIEEIRRLNGGKLPTAGYLYKVTLIEPPCKRFGHKYAPIGKTAEGKTLWRCIYCNEEGEPKKPDDIATFGDCWHIPVTAGNSR